MKKNAVWCQESGTTRIPVKPGRRLVTSIWIIVPLHWAHNHGAANWPKSQKRTFANDPHNLIAVEDNLNQAKSDKDPSEWMPPNQSYRCEYLDRFNSVVDEYHLQPT
jgi:hypothetical protein